MPMGTFYRQRSPKLRSSSPRFLTTDKGELSATSPRLARGGTTWTDARDRRFRSACREPMSSSGRRARSLPLYALFLNFTDDWEHVGCELIGCRLGRGRAARLRLGESRIAEPHPHPL